MSPKSRGWATREEALDAAKKAIDELNQRLEVEERNEPLMKKLTLFLLIFTPIFLIIYGVVSKVVISGKSNQVYGGSTSTQAESDSTATQSRNAFTTKPN